VSRAGDWEGREREVGRDARMTEDSGMDVTKKSREFLHGQSDGKRHSQRRRERLLLRFKAVLSLLKSLLSL
jgi:hypothetical protein